MTINSYNNLNDKQSKAGPDFNIQNKQTYLNKVKRIVFLLTNEIFEKRKILLILKNLKLKPCPLPGPAHIHPVQLIVRRHTLNLEWKKKS